MSIVCVIWFGEKIIYMPYIKMLQAELRDIRLNYLMNFDKGVAVPRISGCLDCLRVVKYFVVRKIKHCYNVIEA